MRHFAATRIQRTYRLYRIAKKEGNVIADERLREHYRQQDELLLQAQPEVSLDEHAHLELDIAQEDDDTCSTRSHDTEWYYDNPIELCGYRCGLQCWECQRRADYYSREPMFDLADEF